MFASGLRMPPKALVREGVGSVEGIGVGADPRGA